ncbi:class I SAM-dependent methyltransferase [Synechococcus sp. MIT S9503]|uniref:class I SAM-dependent methyltransferase n=1 Tax=Synechococcus sp. MIT S9503 TaxID=3082547 RepID=UPI0039A48B4D
MTSFEELFNQQPKNSLDDRQISYLQDHLTNYAGFPNVTQCRKLLDAVWDDLGCNSTINDEKIHSFYSHPVWLLNGLMHENLESSKIIKALYCEYIASFMPLRFADVGGGLGMLSMKVATKLPSTNVECIEPFPTKLALERAKLIPNLSFKDSLSGDYDFLCATDVFEHVFDPIALLAKLSENLKVDGIFLIANCFYPVIKCHLPQNYHLRFSWHQIMVSFGYKKLSKVGYGVSYVKISPILNISKSYKLAKFSHSLYSVIYKDLNFSESNKYINKACMIVFRMFAPIYLLFF